MGNTFYFGWEVRLMEWLQSIFGNSLGIGFFSFISEFGEDLFCVAILGFLYWGYNKEMGRYVGLNLTIANIWNPFIKNIFMRRRPYLDNPSIQLFKKIEADADIYDIAAQGFSFPSGHSTASASAYGSIVAKAKKKWIKVIFVIIPLLVGISRFVLGAHYPTDVLVGWALGIVAIFVVPAVRKKVKNDYLFYGIFLLIGLPGFFFCKSTDFYSAYGMYLGLALGLIFESKIVNFENTNSILRCIIRTVVGGGLFVCLNALFKVPFSKEFLDTAAMGPWLVRVARYTLVVFIVVGIYPMIFKYTAKIGKKD